MNIADNSHTPATPSVQIPKKVFPGKSLSNFISQQKPSLSDFNNHIIDTNDQNATIPSNDKHSDELIIDIASNFERNNNNNDKTEHLRQKYTSGLVSLCCNSNNKNNNSKTNNCNKKEQLPKDCANLLESMINISIFQNLSFYEIDIFASRIEYLMKFLPQKSPLLFIHVPKTGGTTLGNVFGNNMQRINRDDHSHEKHDKTIYKHFWSPFDLTRAFLSSRRKQIWMIFGHLPHGFHKLFLNGDDWANHIEYDVNGKLINPKNNKSIKKEEKQNENAIENKNKTAVLWQTRINYTYATFLRHPVSRVKSHYYYHKYTMGVYT